MTKTVKIMSSFQSDHSAVILNKISKRMLKQGPSYWKFKTSLINDKHYNDKLDSFENKEDPSALWEYVKFKIREFTISYSKNIAIERRQKLSTLSSKLYETEKYIQIILRRNMKKLSWKPNLP